MRPDGKIFIAGKRFRLSKLGVERCPRFLVKTGEVVKVRKNTTAILVRFDGNKESTKIHRSYIEPDGS